MKNDDLMVPGMYCIQHECDKEYGGQICSTTETMYNNHTQYRQLHHPGKSDMTQQPINFKDTTLLVEMTGYMECIIEVDTEIQLHPSNFNRGTKFLSAIHGTRPYT